MSTCTTATDPSCRRARAIDSSSSSSNIARFGSSVRSSWYARNATCSSARLRSVMSIITPCERSGWPRSSRISTASSRSHTVRPSFAITRYSRANGSPVSLWRSFCAMASARSSGCSTRGHMSSVVVHSSGVYPRIASTWGLM